MKINKPQLFKKRDDAPKDVEVVEIFESALRELFFVENPKVRKEIVKEGDIKKFIDKYKDDDVWVYYPWNKKLVHCPKEELYFKLRTARNKNVIKFSEQNNYRNCVVGVAGGSVGSSIVMSLVQTGGPKSLKIADFDTVEVTNLNRIKANLLDVGKNKAQVLSHNIYELDPFAKIQIWEKGIDNNTLLDFINKPKVDIFVDEIDDLKLKLKLRQVCREKRIPVMMATDIGDSVIVDIERFDLEPQMKFLHNLFNTAKEKDLDFSNFQEWAKLGTQIVGPEFLTEKTQDSLSKIGKDICSVPQLGSSANLAGAVVSFAIRRIANKQDMPSGRYVINFEETFVPGYNSKKSKEQRKKKTGKFIKDFLK